MPPIVPKSPEVPRTPENQQENPELSASAETPEREAQPERQPAAVERQPAAAAAPAAPVRPQKDPELMRVERTLEDGLGDIYVAMPKAARQRFKLKGEAVAVTLRTMIASAKISAKKVLALIRDWLKMIPGVNRYFLEQEAKLKTDRILELAAKRKDGAGQ